MLNNFLKYENISIQFIWNKSTEEEIKYTSIQIGRNKRIFICIYIYVAEELQNF